MKSLQSYIINEQQVNEAKELPAEKIKGPITGATNHFGYDVVIVGKPFASDKDENYKAALEILKKLDVKLDNTFEMARSAWGDEADSIKHWVIFVNINNEAVIEPYGQKYDGVHVTA